MTSSALVTFSIHNNYLYVDLLIDEVTHSAKTPYYFPNIHREIVNGMLLSWMTLQIKKLFFSMPIEVIRYDIPPKVNILFGKKIKQLTRLIENTNEFYSNTWKNTAYNNRFDIKTKEEKLLFINIDNSTRLLKLHEKMKAQFGSNVLYENMASGFDPITRTWNMELDPQYFQRLIKTIIENGITRIFSINNNFLTHSSFKQGIYLPALLKKLQIKVFLYEFDPPDEIPGGYFIRNLYSWKGCTRLKQTNYQNYWDDFFDTRHNQFFPLPNNYNQKDNFIKLHNNYKIGVFSNPRTAHVQNELPTICYILESIPKDRIIEDFQLWYFSIREIIQQDTKLTPIEKIYYSARILKIGYGISQFVKYEIIDQVSAEHPIEIYGGKEWNILFPNLSMNQRLNSQEFDQLLGTGQYVWLIMNWYHTILASGALQDALSRPFPHLSFTPLVDSPELASYEQLSYRNIDDLKIKLKQAPELFQRNEVNDAVQNARDIMEQGILDMSSYLMTSDQESSELLSYDRLLRSHESSLAGRVIEFIKNNSNLLSISFDFIIKNRVFDFDLANSRYYSRPYFQNLLTCRNQRLNNEAQSHEKAATR